MENGNIERIIREENKDAQRKGEKRGKSGKFEFFNAKISFKPHKKNL